MTYISALKISNVSLLLLGQKIDTLPWCLTQYQLGLPFQPHFLTFSPTSSPTTPDTSYCFLNMSSSVQDSTPAHCLPCLQCPYSLLCTLHPLLNLYSNVIFHVEEYLNPPCRISYVLFCAYIQHFFTLYHKHLFCICSSSQNTSFPRGRLLTYSAL